MATRPTQYPQGQGLGPASTRLTLPKIGNIHVSGHGLALVHLNGTYSSDDPAREERLKQLRSLGYIGQEDEEKQ